MSRGLARGFAVELAARAGQPATLLYAHVKFREGAEPACLYDGYEITVDARGRFGPLRPSVLELVSFSKEDLNTDIREIDGAVSTSFLTESELSAVLAAHGR